MKIKVSKSALKGKVSVPGSKSHTIRSIVIGLLGEGTSTIINPLMSADTISCIEGAKTLGATVKISESEPKIITLTGTGKNFKNSADLIDVGNSGTSLSLLTSAAALFNKKIIFDGDDSIRSRPMLSLLLSLKDLGAEVSSKNNSGKCPYEVKGPITGGETTIDGITSQYLSSLLISCPLAFNTSRIKVKNLHEKPYVDITLFWLNKMGIKYKNDGLDYFEIPGNQKYPDFSEQIPSDFSTACFPLCAAAITKSDITIQGLDFSDPQGDKAIFEQMKKMGLKFEVKNKETIIKGSQSELKGITIDLNATPDALPVMSIVGCFAKGTTVLANVPQARIKECDRIAAMAKELKKMGADIEEMKDGLIIRESKLTSTTVDSYKDHRIVMSLALAGMICDGETIINDAEHVKITYPEFVSDMQKMGGKINWLE